MKEEYCRSSSCSSFYLTPKRQRTEPEALNYCRCSCLYAIRFARAVELVLAPTRSTRGAASSSTGKSRIMRSLHGDPSVAEFGDSLGFKQVRWPSAEP